ncbi:glycosyltransferase family 2 protein [Ornithinimicrobium cryptoxanthini]|uniref:glycosyltransferase family 2 protein n=1 Tax=Ornithinimicrobium cryptoxanthini TaxID=2934161 RepID=UPI002117372A|nr:glycosyltransferase [Ornithinimicrobium cryptoxanthini]
MVKGKFSAVIPTLQKSPELWPLVQQLTAHPLVHEVLIVNNASAPLAWDSSKVRVLQQAVNIYVNPAWNLGAREATGEYLAIINDDVRFDDEALDAAGRVLRRGWFGIVGPDRSCFATAHTGRVKVRPARHTATIHGFGTFMCLRRSAFIPIPEDMRIWGGDDWLIQRQGRPPGALLNVRFVTEMGTTSMRPEAQALRAEEQQVADAILLPLHGSQWWHRPLRWLDRLREVRHRLR